MLNAILEAWTLHPEVTHGVVLGDVFDEHEWIHGICLQQWTDFLDEALKMGKFIYHILGNHEMLHANDYPATTHTLTPFKGRSGYMVIDRPVDTLIGALIPYAPNGLFQEALNKTTLPLVFCHQEFKGSVDDTRGDEEPVERKIISGHIHEPKRFGNIWYPGSPAQTNFGEADDKAIYVIETSENDYKVISKIRLNIRNFVTLEVPWDSVMPEVDMDKSYYRFEVTTTRTNISIFKASKLYDQMLEVGKVKMTVLPEEKVIKKEGVTFRSALNELLSTEESLKELMSYVLLPKTLTKAEGR
jgi:hypothetical protein